MVVYLDATRVIGKRQTATPINRSRSGYGSKLPTSWQLQLADKKWRRVYVVCWSNAGSAYVLVAGKPQYLGSYDPNE